MNEEKHILLSNRQNAHYFKMAKTLYENPAKKIQGFIEAKSKKVEDKLVMLLVPEKGNPEIYVSTGDLSEYRYKDKTISAIQAKEHFGHICVHVTEDSCTRMNH